MPREDMPHQNGASHPNGKIAAFVAVLSTALFVALTALVVGQRTDTLDRSLILALRTSATPWLTALYLGVTYTSGRLAIPAVVGFAFVLYRRRGVRPMLYYLGACATAQLLNAIVKHEVGRVRPHGISPRLTAAGGFGYPSADAMLAVVIFGLSAVMLRNTLRARAARGATLGAAAMFIVLAAVARVYLGAHWPTDVLGGELAGTACAACWLLAFWRSPAGRVPADPLGAAA